MSLFKLGRISPGDALRNRMNDEGISEGMPAGRRSSVNMDPYSCTMCGECEQRCPAAAIRLYADENIWEINRMRCVLCGICADICPEKCLAVSDELIGAEFNAIADVFNIGEKPGKDQKR